MLASITAYTVSIWIHVSAVVVGFGATFAEALMFPVAMSSTRATCPTCTGWGCDQPAPGHPRARR